MKRLRLGKDLMLPLDWVQLATVVYGARGSGKTSFGRRAAEEAHKLGQRFCAIDLKGDWWGLKSSADGKSEGLPVVIFGGDHGDLPLEEGAGAFVAETVAGLGQSTILDLEHFSKGKQVRFLAQFFDKLYDANRENLLLLLDESQRYAPQARMMDPESAKCLGAVEDLVKLGRKHGIGPVLFTQRGSSLNKEVSELCDMLVAFRTPGPLDQARVKDWLDANATKAERDAVMDKLSGLPTGTAVFASGHPELKTFGVYAIDRPGTFDSSATPRPGQRRVEPKKLAAPDLKELRERMAHAIERAKADDPRELRRRIAELEKQLAAKPAPPPPQPALDKKLLQKLEDALVDVSDMQTSITYTKEVVSGQSKELLAIEAVLRKALDTLKGVPPVLVPNYTAPPSRQAAKPNGASKNSNGTPVGGGLQRMLVALAQTPKGLSSRQLGVRAGLSSKSGTFSTYLSRARSEGWVEGSSVRMVITDAGLKSLGPYTPLPTGDALRDYWMDELGGGAARMLGALADAYPKALTNEDLGERAGLSASSGTFSTYLSRLRTLELVTGRGELRASDELFS